MKLNRLISLIESMTLADCGWAAAVRDLDGEITTSDFHLDAYRKAGVELDQYKDRESLKNDGWEEGFVDSTGKFYDRAQALSKWREERSSIKPSRKWGDSSDLIRSDYCVGM